MSTLNGRNKLTVSAKTASYTVTEADNGKVFTNTGASGAITFSLPAATQGLVYRFNVGAAQELRIDPNGSQTIGLPPTTNAQQAAGKYISADAVGEQVEVYCVITGTWSVRGTGTWTAEV